MGVGRALELENGRKVPSLGCVVSGGHRIITTLAYSAVCPLPQEWSRQREGNRAKSQHPVIHGLLCSEKAAGPRLKPSGIRDALENYLHLPLSILQTGGEGGRSRSLESGKGWVWRDPRQDRALERWRFPATEAEPPGSQEGRGDTPRETEKTNS